MQRRGDLAQKGFEKEGKKGGQRKKSEENRGVMGGESEEQMRYGDLPWGGHKVGGKTSIKPKGSIGRGNEKNRRGEECGNANERATNSVLWGTGETGNLITVVEERRGMKMG